MALDRDWHIRIAADVMGHSAFRPSFPSWVRNLHQQPHGLADHGVPSLVVFHARLPAGRLQRGLREGFAGSDLVFGFQRDQGLGRHLLVSTALPKFESLGGTSPSNRRILL